jgi:Icc-related predicted phosphoesterase
MKIVAISDTHEQHFSLKIPKCDLLIVAGDFTYKGDFFAVRDFLYGFLQHQPATNVIVTPGNHELTLEDRNSDIAKFIEDFCKANHVNYLIDSEVTINNMKVWGSPYTPYFGGWAFNVERDQIQKHWDKIPLDTEILVLHGPPYGILDTTREGNKVGCEALTNTIKQKLKNLKICIFGHIHEAYGQIEIDGIKYYNVSICDRSYKPVNPVTVIEL